MKILAQTCYSFYISSIALGLLVASLIVPLPIWLQEIHYISYLPRDKPLIVGISATLFGGLGIALYSIYFHFERKTRIKNLSTPYSDAVIAKGLPITIAMLIYTCLITKFALVGYTHYDLLALALSLILIIYSLPQATEASNQARYTTIDIIVSLLLFFSPVIIFSSSLTSWYFSIVGDEGVFYELGSELAESPHANPFDWSAVYGKFPALDSYYTATIIAIFGKSIWSWKFSLIIVQGLTAALIYYLGRTLLSRTAGLIAGVALVSSHYLTAFSHIGYNNTHQCLTATAIMCILAHAWRTPSARATFLLGLSSGALYYSIWGGLLILPAVFLMTALTICYRFSGLKRKVAIFLLFIFGHLILLIPGLVFNYNEGFTEIATRLNHGADLFSSSTESILKGISISLAAFLQNRWWSSHYVAGALIDPISGFLLVVGFFWAIGGVASWILNIRRQSIPFTLLLAALWFTSITIGVPVFSSSHAPMLTRLVAALPAIALLCGIGFQVLTQKISWQPARFTLQAFTILAICTLNIQQLFIISPITIAHNYERIIVQQAQSAQNSKVYFLLPSRNSEGFARFMNSNYLMETQGVKLIPLEERDLADSAGVKLHFQERDKLIAPKKLLPLLKKIQSEQLRHAVIGQPILREDLYVLNFKGPPTLPLASTAIPSWIFNILGAS
jgi:4-amino-4-deoxy-L-arabinose transferase-like glycosyltransferase